jgi:hypothetical protein
MIISRFQSFCITVLSALVVGLIGFFMGLDAGRDAAKVTAMKAAAAAYTELVTINKQTVEDERALRMAERAEHTKYRATQEKRNHETETVIADLHAGARRLRIPVRRDAQACPVPGGSTTAGTGAEGYADVTAGAAEFLVRLTARGDTAIAKHAAVVDSYDRLAAACAAHGQGPGNAAP